MSRDGCRLREIRRIKVVDTLLTVKAKAPRAETMITLFDVSQEDFEEIK